MEKIIHRSNERGAANHGWLKSYHSFSFAGYYDPHKIHFGMLRVLNDDTVAPGMGFGQHPHNNMEIVSIPLSGELQHKDTLGTSTIIRTNEVQIMSAGSGIEHSEYNHSQTEPVKFFQIWVFPKIKNIKPRYDQKRFDPALRVNKWQTVVSPLAADEAIWINQDAWFSMSNLQNGQSIDYAIKQAGNGAYLLVVEGEVDVAGETLGRRDALGISGIETLQIKAKQDSHLLLIDVPMR